MSDDIVYAADLQGRVHAIESRGAGF
jgi:hypothetical protein